MLEINIIAVPVLGEGHTVQVMLMFPDANSIPLSKPLPWLPPLKYATVTDSAHEARITKLDNGLTCCYTE